MAAADWLSELLMQTVDRFVASLGSKMDGFLVDNGTDLDGRFEVVRSQESNLGNFVCDVLRLASGADVVLLNSGVCKCVRLWLVRTVRG